MVMKLNTIITWLRARLTNAYGIDERSLALFRISVGLVILLDLVLRFRHSLTLYSDAGVLPRRDVIPLLSQFRWSVLLANGTPEFVNLVFWVGLLAAAAMIIGWRTRLATVVLWIVLISLQARNPHLSSGADTLMRVSLFWAMFLPLGRLWSLDSHLAKSADGLMSPSNRSGIVSTVATLGLIIQVSCVYLFTALQKDGPRWREEGSALYFALGARDVSSVLGDWIFRNAPEALLVGLTYGSLLVEFAIPIMLLLPMRSGWLRTAAVFLILTLHAGIGLTMTVGLFPAISIASAIGIMPTWFWEKVVVRVSLGSAAAALKQQIARMDLPALPGAPSPEATRSPKTNVSGPLAPTFSRDSHLVHFVHPLGKNRLPLAALIGNVGAALAIVIVLAWNVQTVSSFETPQPLRHAAISTGLYQNWSMFAPGPQAASIWFVVEGELESGEKVDLLRPIFEDDVSLREPVVWNQSSAIVLKDKYWRKYFTAIRGRKTDSLRFAAYTCRTWNAENVGDQRLSRVTLTRGVASTRSDGTRADPAFDQVGSWNCS